MKNEPLEWVEKAHAEIDKIKLEDLKSLSPEEKQEFKRLTAQVLFQIAVIEKQIEEEKLSK